MNRSIRVKFFAWLGVQTLLVFFVIGIVLILFNLHEQHEHPDLQEEEAKEALVVAGFMALLFPLALGSAWLISRRLLRPWQQLVAQAERIGQGNLAERIEVEEAGDEIGRLATTLNTAFDRHQYLNDRLQRFSYDASHQLRNPLSAIRTSGEVCLSRDRTNEEYVKVIGEMLENTNRLSRTVEQLLMLARAAQDTLDEQRMDVDLASLVDDVARDARIIGEDRKLDIVFARPDQPMMLSGVKELIREALANLVDNAIRYSPDGGVIELAVEEVPQNMLRFSVADQGPGLSPARQATIFRPFSREKSVGKESTGLGLAIVSDIGRIHGGAAGVDNGPEGGSVFWISFPKK